MIFRADLAALKAMAIGRGEAIYFVGCVAHAAYAPLIRRLNRGEPAVVFTFGTVSYTHLDVYKRQAGPGRAGLRRDLGQRVGQNGIELGRLHRVPHLSLIHI